MVASRARGQGSFVNFFILGLFWRRLFHRTRARCLGHELSQSYRMTVHHVGRVAAGVSWPVSQVEAVRTPVQTTGKTRG